MKTQIELHEATYTRNGIKVNYVVYDEAGDAIVTQTLPIESVIEWVEENRMNVISLLNTFDLEYEDVELTPSTYLEENLNDVVTAYLTSNLEREAA